MTAPAPRVSVITATYNRSNVLRLAIESVRASRFGNWEMVIVGDACTDDTAEVVASFQDERIRFINLEQNFGEQSGPNNFGISHARGEFVAFLNHDDLWFPDHLEEAIRELESASAQGVFTWIGAVRDEDGEQCNLLGATATGRYELTTYAPASSWVLRRGLLAEVGPWRSSKECCSIPSQDWLQRARKMGKVIRQVPRLTVMAIESGNRPGGYARRDSREHEELWRKMRTEPDFRERVLAGMLAELSAREADFRIGKEVKRLVRASVFSALVAVGVAPSSVRDFLRYGRKGGRVKELRGVRGLKPH